MDLDYYCLAIIPARGGSKSIPDKNIAPVGGKPLIEWTILAARESKNINQIIVSTDSNEIAELSRSLGVDVPFLRPEQLAKDDTPGILPVLHALNWFINNEDYHPEFVICLQPTSPLRTFEDIDASIELAMTKNADAVISVSSVTEHPYWMKSLDEDGRISEFINEKAIINRRQDLPTIYSLNGAIYLARSEFLLEQGTWYSENTFGYVMPIERSLDIDSLFDLYLADLMLKGDFEL